jgi:hypothetical protein
MSKAFTKRNLRGVITALNRFKEPQAIMDRILERLCEIGREAIETAYSDGMTGSSADSVKVVNEGDGRWSITAESYGLLYLEFGAGVGANPDGGESARRDLDKIDGSEVVVPIGTGPFSQNPTGWYYRQGDLVLHTRGTRARHGFANAITAIYAAKDQIIKEEFLGK